MGSLLRLFADAPAVVLTRSPLGVASSFARSQLSHRWGYADRYRQLVTMTAAGPHERFAALVPDDDPDELTALTRLIVLNTVLLADALDGRGHAHIRLHGRRSGRVRGRPRHPTTRPRHRARHTAGRRADHRHPHPAGRGRDSPRHLAPR